MLAASLLLDAAVRPRAGGFRCWPGVMLHLVVMTGVFGLGLAIAGALGVATVLALAFMALLLFASNAKYAVLGEPLVFSDFALIVAVFRHPRFYLVAVSTGQRWLLAAGAAFAVLVFAALYSPEPKPHLAGLGLMIGAAAAVTMLLNSRWFAGEMHIPALEHDVRRFGLLAILVLYWNRWREIADPPPLVPAEAAARANAASLPLIVIVQCESFCDPVEITGLARDALPGLARARQAAWQWGELAVSGFGAYTMRTEYGVLFGRSEEALGFRRFDPFLTAQGEASYALPARLSAADYHCTFVHPHDMRFYRRDRLMPTIGFHRIIDDAGFAPAAADGGRYVGDKILGAALCALIDAAPDRSLLYAVTMENHGPWDGDEARGPAGRLAGYIRHVRNSDAMLTALADHLARDSRPSLLVFFGDHRPSIAGVTAPHGPRHTPYVMLRFGEGARSPPGGARRVDLAPDALHHAILHAFWPAPDPGPPPGVRHHP